MVTAHLTVFRDGKEIDKAYPGKWVYRKHEQQPITDVAIRRSLAEDLYIVMPGFELQDQSVTLQVVVNPLVDWIWAGFGILVLARCCDAPNGPSPWPARRCRLRRRRPCSS
jgi:cytochrome c-type biogenesis protein CcmF